MDEPKTSEPHSPDYPEHTAENHSSVGYGEVIQRATTSKARATAIMAQRDLSLGMPTPPLEQIASRRNPPSPIILSAWKDW